VSVWVLIGVMVALSGAIAYAGDRIGSFVGRKRLSLFGLRPRTTAITVAILSGMLITMITLAGGALIFRQATETILAAEEMRGERDALARDRDRLAGTIDRLEGERQRLQSEIDRLRTTTAEQRLQLGEQAAELAAQDARLAAQEGELARQEAELANLRVARADVERDRDAIAADLVQIRQRFDSLTAQYLIATGALDELQDQVSRYEHDIQVLSQTRSNLAADLQRLQAQLREAQGRQSQLILENDRLAGENVRLKAEVTALTERVAALQREDFILRRGDLVSWQLIDARTDTAAREAVLALVRRAEERAYVLGAQPAPGQRTPLVISAQEVDAAVAAIAAAGGQTVGVVRSLGGVLRGDPVQVLLEVRPNRALYRAGQVIALRQVYLGRPGAPRSGQELRTFLLGLLAEAIGDIRRLAALPEILPDPAGSAGILVQDMLSRLRLMSGWVTVGVFATTELRPSGPFDPGLAFLILGP
jgi:uncharacterized protein (DUF3084 family)